MKKTTIRDGRNKEGKRKDQRSTKDKDKLEKNSKSECEQLRKETNIILQQRMSTQETTVDIAVVDGVDIDVAANAAVTSSLPLAVAGTGESSLVLGQRKSMAASSMFRHSNLPLLLFDLSWFLPYFFHLLLVVDPENFLRVDTN
ncbi:hypothetical protein V6N11_032798 [Hibiscus sabdariffa]|uniref:Uncharacterized protein n=1 Tax=Hibiscus sabdariffa TaxID=183260 RepID=A0ABR2T2C1_9ROSI